MFESKIKLPPWADIFNLEDFSMGPSKLGHSNMLNKRRRSTGNIAEDSCNWYNGLTSTRAGQHVFNLSHGFEKFKEMSTQTKLSFAFADPTSMTDLSFAVLNDGEGKLHSGNCTPATTQTDLAPDSIATAFKPCLSDDLELSTGKPDLDDPESISESPRSRKFFDHEHFYLATGDSPGVISDNSEDETVKGVVRDPPSPFVQLRDYPKPMFTQRPGPPKKSLTVVILDEASGELGQVAITLNQQKPTVSDIKQALTEAYGEAATSGIRLVIRSNARIVDLRDDDKVRGRRAFVVGLNPALVHAS
mmetsp:Transcript_54217/g.101640  ORF Transcript_54217/g.101640 Transcript_54217/m.101640 type:complete len:304 (-) Transcript_54217:116-1027(-)